jgi:hypothetical protein
VNDSTWNPIQKIMYSTRYWNVNTMVSTDPNDMVNGKISERQISDARNV